MGEAAAGWLSDAGGISYPPEPWHLQGTAYLSLWRVPAGELAAAGCLSPGTRPATLLGQALVATAWAVYGPGGSLAYNEVLAAVRVRAGGRGFATVTHIWVDHPASAAGGRALWAMPKQLATFRSGDRGGGFAASAADPEGRPVAALRFRGRATLPGRWRWRTRTAQPPLGGGQGRGLTIARAEARASVELGTAAWDFAPDRPLGFLRGRVPLVSARLTEVTLRFGG